jgi:hypothetical protein
MNIKPNVVKNSAMRFSLTIISITICVVLLGVAAYIVLKAINGEEPQWSEMGVFIAGLAALLTGSGWNKAKQKETEINENK